MNLSELARIVFKSQLERMQLNLDGCIAGLDPIHLHDLRVANRRTRGALNDFQNLLPNEVVEKYLEEFRWIHKITGPVRDIDIGLSRFPAYEKKISKNWRRHLVPAREMLEIKRQSAQEELVSVLNSKKVSDLFSSWSDLLESGMLDGSEYSLEPAREYGCLRIIKRYRRTRKTGLELGKKSHAEQFHDFRIRVKELRYLMEFFQLVVDQEEYDKLRIEIKNVQDALGVYQDADIQVACLIHLAEDLDKSGSSLDPILALGQWIGIYEKEIRSARKKSLIAVRWLTNDLTAREFQSCFKYPVD